jgi:hypothetical protein
LDLQVRGAQSKPDELSLQILFASIAAALERHNVPATISEYEVVSGGRQKRRSLYLRLAEAVANIVGLRLPKDVKGLALRAKRKHIKFEGGEIDRSREAMYLKRTNTAKTG